MSTSTGDQPRENPWTACWQIRPDTIYLNHGSFGPPPIVVQESRAAWQRRLDGNPMDFFVRELADEVHNVRDTIATFVGARSDDLVLVDNATYGMNVVADSFPLSPGDEVLLTDHEYGAVRRIWDRRIKQSQGHVRTVTLPSRVDSAEEVVEVIAATITACAAVSFSVYCSASGLIRCVMKYWAIVVWISVACFSLVATQRAS